MRTYKHIFSLIQWNKYYIYFIKLYLVSCRFHFSILWNILPELSFNYANLIVNSEYNMLLKLQQPRKYVVGDRSSWVFGVKSEIWRTSGKSLRAQTSQTSACSLNIVDHSSAVYKTTNNRILTKRLPFWNKSKEVCISLQSCFSVQHFMRACVCVFIFVKYLPLNRTLMESTGWRWVVVDLRLYWNGLCKSSEWRTPLVRSLGVYIGLCSPIILDSCLWTPAVVATRSTYILLVL